MEQNLEWLQQWVLLLRYGSRGRVAQLQAAAAALGCTELEVARLERRALRALRAAALRSARRAQKKQP